MNPNDDPDLAVEIIRSKLSDLYKAEPPVKDELKEVAAAKHRSKHQQVLYELSNSTRSLADIQTAWHAYYANLPDQEKHEVWREFYEEHGRQQKIREKQPPGEHAQKIQAHPEHVYHQQRPLREPVSKIKNRIAKHAAPRHPRQSSKKHHIKSLMFGLGTGMIVVAVLLFGFFNERFIAPFISPSKSISNTQIIINPGDTAVGPEPKIIIPKINLEMPVVYDANTTDEQTIQKSLEKGVAHYSSTPVPGEQGNVVIFGHSSNNILNPGKYKFAFVLLKQLQNEDTFMINRDGKRYVYKVIEKKVVSPQEFSIIQPIAGKTATATLVTCDPPGTSINRLVIVGEQISPDPGSNATSQAVPDQNDLQELPGNSETLWSRFVRWISG